MKYNIYSVRDVKTVFGTPFVDSSDDSAIRGFRFAYLNNNNSLLGYSPSDFSLYRIGSFDSSTGKVESELPVHICDATSFVNYSSEVDSLEK